MPVEYHHNAAAVVFGPVHEAYRRINFVLRAFVAALFLGGCAALNDTPGDGAVMESAAAPIQQSAPPLIVPQAAPFKTPAPPPVAPFDDAVSAAADALFSEARARLREIRAGALHRWLIDPLIDGLSGMQSIATRAAAKRIVEIAAAKHPEFDVQQFSGATVGGSPLVLMGTLTPINGSGESKRPWKAYSLCLVLADLSSGTIVAKSTAQAHLEGVDPTPTPYFLDSPGWIKDAATERYIETCRSAKSGDSVPAPYGDGMRTSALISEAIALYEAGGLRGAFDLLSQARRFAGGNEWRIYNGLYLVNLKLGRQMAALEAFGHLVDYGLMRRQLAVKFHFRPGSASFATDRQAGGIYALWLRQIARRAAKSDSCFEITGHSSASGPEPLNERLSQMRAEYIMKRLESDAPQLRGRTIASGAGSRENLLGTGTDDLSDALDRRVALHVHSCT